MKYGGVAPQPTGLDRYVSVLSQMRASTVRVSMFLNDASYRRFDDAALDRLLSAGLTEMIINSSEIPHGDRCRWELGSTGLIEYIRNHPNILFIYELGNEPDTQWGGDPYQSRWRILTAIRDIRPAYPASNMYWAVNMPQQTASYDYTYNFVRDIGDGLGPIIPGPSTGAGQINTGNIPQMVTAHCYGYGTLCPSDANNPTVMLDRVRSWNSIMNMKVTEAGINDQGLADSGERGRRYVDFGESVLPGQYGDVDSLTFYALGDADPSVPAYNMTDAEAQVIGQRQRAGLC